MVWVSPGMFDTKVMVAPNSPIALAKPSTMPASTPGSASGRVTVANTCHGAAPSVPAACSSRRSIASIDRRVEHRLAPEIAAGQKPRQSDPERRRYQGCDDSDPQGEQDRRPFGRRNIEHVCLGCRAGEELEAV